MTKSLVTVRPTKVFEILRDNEEDGIHTFLHGASGIGKTAIVEQFAKAEADRLGLSFWHIGLEAQPAVPVADLYGYIDARVATWDALDVKGAPVADVEREVTRFLTNSVLPDADRHGIRGLVNFDELPQGVTSVSNALSQIFLGGHIGDAYTFPKGWQIVATGNRKCDNAGTNKIGAQTYNRFANYEVVPHPDDFAQYLARNGSDGRVGAFARLKEELLSGYSRGDIAFSSPRMLEACDKKIRKIDDGDFLETQLAALVSVEVASELVGFLKICTQLTSFSQIVKSPDTAKVPQAGEEAALAATFALISMCAGKQLTEKNIGAVITYVERLPEDFQTTWALDVISNHPDLQETVEFSTWRSKHGSFAV
jgi:hypothetical protein